MYTILQFGVSQCPNCLGKKERILGMGSGTKWSHALWSWKLLTNSKIVRRPIFFIFIQAAWLSQKSHKMHEQNSGISAFRTVSLHGYSRYRDISSEVVLFSNGVESLNPHNRTTGAVANGERVTFCKSHLSRKSMLKLPSTSQKFLTTAITEVLCHKAEFLMHLRIWYVYWMRQYGSAAFTGKLW